MEDLFAERMLHITNTSSLNYSESQEGMNSNISARACRQHVVLAELEEAIPEGIFWLFVALASFWLNASAIHTLNKKRKLQKIYRIYLSNVFFSNLSMGSVVYLTYAAIRFGFENCSIRDTCYIGTVSFTNVNQISMICVMCCQLRVFCRVGSMQLGSIRTSVKIHVTTVIASWIISAGLVAYKMRFDSNTRIIFIFTVVKVLLILVLNLYVIKRIKKCSDLRPKMMPPSTRNEMENTKRALRIVVAFQCITIVTWCPLLNTIFLQRFNIVPGESLILPILICVRIVFLGPLIDPIFYFWSRRNIGNKLKRLRRQRKRHKRESVVST